MVIIMSAVIKSNAKLEHSNLSQYGVSEIGFLSILSGMNQTCTLKYLDVSSNKINENVAKQLTNVVSSNRNMNHLNISNTNLEFIQLFSTLFGTNINLKHLDLSHSLIESQDFEALAKLLKGSTTMEHLDLSWTLLQEAGVHAIFSVLINKTSLHHLNLESCAVNNA